MKWIKMTDKKPPVDKRVLVAWKNISNKMVCGVSERNLVSPYTGSPERQDRYWIFGSSSSEISYPLLWCELPPFPEQGGDDD